MSAKQCQFFIVAYVRRERRLERRRWRKRMEGRKETDKFSARRHACKSEIKPFSTMWYTSLDLQEPKSHYVVSLMIRWCSEMTLKTVYIGTYSHSLYLYLPISTSHSLTHTHTSHTERQSGEGERISLYTHGQHYRSALYTYTGWFKQPIFEEISLENP